MTSRLTYTEQLKHPNWQRRRLEMLESAGWQCSNCGAKEASLHVHHRQYFKGRMAWEYAEQELDVLCEDCHRYEHDTQDAMKAILAQTITSTNLGLLAGFHRTADWIDESILESGRQSDPHAFASGFIAYLSHGLDIDQKFKLAEFAASMHQDAAEARMWFEHSRGKTFGEDA